jgi:hypothetical protein
MKTFTLTFALSFLILAAISCKKDRNSFTLRSNDNILLNGAQVSSTNTSSGSGKLQASYNGKTRLLSYTVNWTGLTGNVTAVRIQGPADPGFNAPIIQTFTLNTSGASGSYTNNLYVDGFAVKEEDLLNGKYFMTIYTSGFPAGEIRGQIVFK